MPTYEYECKKCGERLEVVQSFSDEPLKKHKGCGGALRKVFGSIGITFKGSGFYKTDSRSSGKSSSSASSSSSDKSPASSSDATKGAASSGSSSTPSSEPKSGGSAKDGGSSASKAAS